MPNEPRHNDPQQGRPAHQSSTAPKQRNAQPWLWQVVLIDDQEHTDTYVVRMMQELFNLQGEKALQIAELVDAHGRAVVLTTHKELAELKRDQILGYGRDTLVATCKGSMNAVIEPAPAQE